MIQFGTCSWKYDSWRGLIYPETGRLNYLEEYAKSYNTVEVDQWFWAMPKKEDVKQYVNSVPDDFRFSVKVPNIITLTHPYKQSKPNPDFLSVDLFNTFISLIEPMHNNLAVLMFQFEYLNKNKMKSLREFISQMNHFFKSCPANFRYGLEIRNPNYLKAEYFKFLNELNVTHIFCHGYYMPPSYEVYDKFSEYIKDRSVIRLMGLDRQKIEEESSGNWNKIYDPKDDDLTSVSKFLQKLVSHKLEIYVYTNNHYEGSAPLTIEKMRNFYSE